ncbi:MAG: LuxR C-terminal-related transcriptional regulator [Syntrophomonadaceae bacterium]
MAQPVEVLEKIAKSGEAVFALDGNDLIIIWNKACERLLGRPAYQVLGRRCYDIMCGRDVYGNRYCGASCPVTYQARKHPEDELHSFLIDYPMPGGGTRRLCATPFAISGGHPSLATIVHVLRDPEAQASPLENELAEAVEEGPAPKPGRGPAGTLASLTGREQEILRKMAQGLTTDGIAEGLFISPVTVRNHIAKILSKLDVHTKLAAVAFAYQNGLVSPEMRELPSLSMPGNGGTRRETPKARKPPARKKTTAATARERR